MIAVHIKPWIIAARPKTLGVSVTSVLMGGALAFIDGGFHVYSLLAALCSAVFIQIGTNFANDYFDYKKGADTKDRIGPLRVMQAGLVSELAMKKAIAFAFLISSVFGLYLIARGGWPILLIGILSILSGLLYTAGPLSLAYTGLSELFVLVFFGPVAVLGTYYVQTLHTDAFAFYVGFVPGLLSICPLAINNLRDREQDLKVNKKTLAVRFGSLFAQVEYIVCLLGGLALAATLSIIHGYSWMVLVPAFALIFVTPAIKAVCTFRDPRELGVVFANTGKLLWLLGPVYFALSALASVS